VIRRPVQWVLSSRRNADQGSEKGEEYGHSEDSQNAEDDEGHKYLLESCLKISIYVDRFWW